MYQKSKGGDISSNEHYQILYEHSMGNRVSLDLSLSEVSPECPENGTWTVQQYLDISEKSVS